MYTFLRILSIFKYHAWIYNLKTRCGEAKMHLVLNSSIFFSINPDIWETMCYVKFVGDTTGPRWRRSLLAAQCFLYELIQTRPQAASEDVVLLFLWCYCPSVPQLQLSMEGHVLGSQLKNCEVELLFWSGSELNSNKSRKWQCI